MDKKKNKAAEEEEEKYLFYSLNLFYRGTADLEIDEDMKREMNTKKVIVGKDGKT